MLMLGDVFAIQIEFFLSDYKRTSQSDGRSSKPFAANDTIDLAPCYHFATSKFSLG